jgi:hypothetical protein
MNKIIASICAVLMIAALSFAIPAAEACEVRGVGYWKNHDAEREGKIVEAAALSPVFNNEQDLRLYLQLKGKKTPMQKVKRQFGAALLNMASGLEGTTALYQGEWELMQAFNQNYVFGATTLEEAIQEIESAVSTSTNLEEARELAEAINNGDYFTACQ